MDFFRYRAGALCAEAAPLDRIAKAVGTPVYVYSSAAIEAAYRDFVGALVGLPATVCYAVKANGNLAVIRTLAALGAGADVVSGGELARALAAGVPAARIVFSGVGKTRAEMAAALDAGVMQINLESEAELEVLDAVARAHGRVASAALRINPDVDAQTHHKITTGKSENKFGIDWTSARRVFGRARELSGVRLGGLAVHIGSQLTDLAPYRAAYRRLAGLVDDLRREGFAIDRLDLGGGLGISYGSPDEPVDGGLAPADYAAVVRETVGGLGCQLVFEPGRALVGRAGVLLTRILYIKPGATRTFVIVDAAMNDLLRPALYDAYHRVQPVRETGGPLAEVDIVGPVCETGDTFAHRRPLPAVEAGDLLAIGAAGAYGAAMASTYNARPLVPEVMVRGESFAVVRKVMTVEDMMAFEALPSWLMAPGEAGR